MSLVSLASLALLAGAPASAANSFSIVLDRSFGDNTGATGRMDFLFGVGPTPNSYTLDLTINNTSAAPTSPGDDGVTASSLVGFAFKKPTSISLSNFLYNANGTNFLSKTDLDIGSFDFDFCANTGPSNSCEGANVNKGLTIGVQNVADNPSGTVKFTFNSNAADVNAVADAFNTLFSQPAPAVNIAARFQGVNYVRNGKSFTGGSDKVTGGGPGGGLGDTVPGPVPLLGAAAAFGYSRKLRRRLKGIAPAS